jgi:hypothetical protein
MFSSYLPISSEGGDVSFKNNVPDPVTCGKELPTFGLWADVQSSSQFSRS